MIIFKWYHFSCNDDIKHNYVVPFRTTILGIKYKPIYSYAYYSLCQMITLKCY